MFGIGNLSRQVAASVASQWGRDPVYRWERDFPSYVSEPAPQRGGRYARGSGAGIAGHGGAIIGSVFASLRRHPFAVEASFRWSLVLAFALPPGALRPMLPRGLELDTYGEGDAERGFLAIALVQTERLRPQGFPRVFGRDFFLSGYRVFARFPRPGRPTLRGLRILRSDTDRYLMVRLGNLFTHYGYRFAHVDVNRAADRLTIDVRTANAEADLHVEADLATTTSLPEGSVFRSQADARRFAGPLPFTFDADLHTPKMLLVRGVRSAWEPRPVRIVSHTSSFLARPEIARHEPRLANAFFVENVAYAWRPGVLEDIA